jgi:hypothetical protein
MHFITVEAEARNMKLHLISVLSGVSLSRGTVRIAHPFSTGL